VEHTGYEPMLATPWPGPFDDPEWWFDVKWDGIRALVEIEGPTVTIRSRRGRVMTESYPELRGWSLPRPTTIDGEIVAFGEAGIPSFQLLQQRMNLTGRAAVAATEKVPVTMVAFDLLYDGESLLGRPIEERWDRLREIVPPQMVVADPVRAAGIAIYEAVGERGLEGVVAKRAGSRYTPGRRSDDWRKIVHRRSGRFVVGGFLPGGGGRGATFGSLALGLFEGDRLDYVGSVGSGFDGSALRVLRGGLDDLGRDTSPFADTSVIPSDVKWVEPALVAVVEYKEWTPDRHLRAPVFKGLTVEPVETVTWEEEGPR
jgi:bifunctional non-homologous end joining protein LigD